MLIKIRSKVAYVTMRLLLVLLIAAFGLWGIGDVIRSGGRGNDVATVGDVGIDGRDFQEQYRREFQRVSASLGGTLEAETARQLGLPERMIERMITQSLLDQAGVEFGMRVSDAVVRATIEADKTFAGETGAFDRARFARVLQQSNLSEAGYVALLRGDVLRQQILKAVAAGAAAPPALVDRLYAYRRERRVAETLTLANDSAKGIAAPDDAALAAFHKDNADRYQSPELRAVTYVRLMPDDLVDEMTVAEDVLRAEVAARRGEFDTPERRTLEQIVLADEAAARAVFEKLRAGGDFAAVAREETGGDPVALGTLEQDDIIGPLADLAEAAFAPAAGEYTEPTPTSLGWHIVKVVAIEPGVEASEAEVREKIAFELKQQQAVDSMIAIANQFDDEIAGGASIEDTAAKLGLKVETIAAADAAGKTPDGADIPDVTGNAALLTLIGSTQEGETTPLTETPDGGYLVLRVDKVTPAGERPFDQVRDQVAADWNAAERDKVTAAKAASIVERVTAGATLAAIAAEEGLTVMTSQGFARDGGDPNANVSLELARKVFKLAPGGATTAPGVGSHTVAVLREVAPADADSEIAAKLKATLTETMADNLLDQFIGALRQEIGVEIDREKLERLLTQP
jgi:peptidyl-prolyl cis-trans isomerase D